VWDYFELDIMFRFAARKSVANLVLLSNLSILDLTTLGRVFGYPRNHCCDIIRKLVESEV